MPPQNQNMQKTKNSFSVKRTFVFPDTHFQPMLNNGTVRPDSSHDPDALSIALQIFCDYKWDNVVHIGDLVEFDMFNSFAPSKKTGMCRGEDGKYYETDINQTFEMVSVFWDFVAKKQRAAKKVQMEGNHDYRIERFISERPILGPFKSFNLRSLPIWKKHKIVYHGYDRYETAICRIGDVIVKHRPSCGSSGEAAFKTALFDGNGMYGHNHKIFSVRNDRTYNTPVHAVTIGCLSSLHPAYNSMGGVHNGYVHGFGYIEQGEKTMLEAVRIDGKTCVFLGKTYHAKPLGQIDKTLEIFDLKPSMYQT